MNNKDNVQLWLFNDEGLYLAVKDALRRSATKNEAARYLVADILPSHTPDGAPYTYTSVRAALVGE